MKKRSVVKKILLTLFVLIIGLPLLWQINAVKVFYYDDIKNVCSNEEYGYYSFDLYSGVEYPLGHPTKFPRDPEWYDGLYVLELCKATRGGDDESFIVKLKDAETGHVYNTGYDSYNVDSPRFHNGSVITHVGDERVCFYYPRKDDLQKEIIEQRVGMPFQEFYRKQKERNKYTYPDCI